MIRKAIFLVLSCFASAIAFAQQPDIQFFRYNDQRGLNVFETTKADTIPFDDFKLRVGGAFAMQYQGLSHSNTANNLVPLTGNFNLPTANLDLDAQLFDGVRMHLRVYLSSRHHEETYVKGGYLQIDKLDFIKKDFLSGFMKYATIKIGHMENNYGDTHFRRTDNAQAIFNPFVGNYIMDAFTTEIGGEVYYQRSGFIAMIGVTNGRLNQSTANVKTNGAFLAKLGYDKQMNEDLRFRLTGSIYSSPGTDRVYMYGGDRAGSRYYNVMDVAGGTPAPSDFSGRVNPGLNSKMTAIMVNPFVKFKGLEFFGVYENSTGRDNNTDAAFTGNRTWTQLGGELLYRFGSKEQLYLGGRYNTISGQLQGQETNKVTVNRYNIGGGWYLTKNILTKIEYMRQEYVDYTSAQFMGGKFSGLMIEATIGF